MKSILISCLAILLLSSAQAQNLHKVTNSLSGEKWEETTWEPIMQTTGHDVRFRFVKKDGTYSLDFIMDARKTRVVEKGTYFGFLDKDGKVILALQCYEGKTTGDNKDIFSYLITKEQIDLLLNSDIYECKLQFREGNIKDRLSDRKLVAFQNAMTLITTQTRHDNKPAKIKEKIR